MATYVLGEVTTTFRATIRGYNEESGTVARVQVGLRFDAEADWIAFKGLVSEGAEPRKTLGGDWIVQIHEGDPGAGVLTITGFQEGVGAVLVEASRNTWLPGKTLGNATFLLVGTATVL